MPLAQFLHRHLRIRYQLQHRPNLGELRLCFLPRHLLLVHVWVVYQHWRAEGSYDGLDGLYLMTKDLRDQQDDLARWHHLTLSMLCLRRQFENNNPEGLVYIQKGGSSNNTSVPENKLVDEGKCQQLYVDVQVLLQRVISRPLNNEPENHWFWKLKTVLKPLACYWANFQQLCPFNDVGPQISHPS